MNTATDLNWHRDFLVLIATRMKPQLYLEIGSGSGSTIHMIVPHCGVAVGVDVKPPELCYSHGWIFHQTDSLAFLREGLPLLKPVELAFIDGYHAKEQITHEFAAMFNCLAPGALVVCHDTYPEDESYEDPKKCDSAWRWAASLRRETAEYRAMMGRFAIESMTLPFPPGLTLIRKLENGCHFHDGRHAGEHL